MFKSFSLWRNAVEEDETFPGGFGDLWNGVVGVEVVEEKPRQFVCLLSNAFAHTLALQLPHSTRKP